MVDKISTRGRFSFGSPRHYGVVAFVAVLVYSKDKVFLC